MPLRVEGVVNRAVYRREPLRRRLRLELLDIPLALADGQMRVFDAVILVEPAWVMNVPEAQRTDRYHIGLQSISVDTFRLNWLITKKIFEKRGRRRGISALLD